MPAATLKKKPLVKLKDVALDAGVSVATVSLALRNHASITEKTHKKVLESTRRLGYTPLRKRKSSIDATREAATQNQSLVYCIVDSPLRKPVYSGFLDGVMNACQHHQIRLELVSWTSDDLFALDASKEPIVQGIILTGNVTPEVVEHFCNRGSKVVVLGNYDISKVHTVEIDAFHAGGIIAKRVVEEGHKNIAYLLRQPDVFLEREYLMGLRDGLALHGVELPPSRIIPASETLASFENIAELLLKMKLPPTAVISNSSTIAEGCFGEIRVRAKSDEKLIPMFYGVSLSRKVPLNPKLALLGLAAEQCGYLAATRLRQIVAGEETPVYATVVRSEEWIH